MCPAVSSRTPEGESSECPLCGQINRLEPSSVFGDLICPACGSLFVQIHQRLTDAEKTFSGRSPDSLTLVELVMEFEERYCITVPDEEYMRLKTSSDFVRLIRRWQIAAGQGGSERENTDFPAR